MLLLCIQMTVLLKLICAIQDGKVSLFVCRLACHTLHLGNKHRITLIPAYILKHLSMNAEYLSQCRLVPEWHLFHYVAQAAF